MIRLKRPGTRHALERETRLALIESHGKTRELKPGEERIQGRWKYFRSKRPDKAGQKVFDALKRCFHNKCVYCEQVAPLDIDHFYPKSSYPRRMFRWRNFMLSCKSCNMLRGERLRLDHAGRPYLIDPTREEPFGYLRWDLSKGTTLINPQPGFCERGQETLDCFNLDLYADERRHKVQEFLYLLSQVVGPELVSQELKEQLRAALLPSRPWLAVVRQIVLFPPSDAHRRLVEVAVRRLPELRTWLLEWLRPPPGVVLSWL